MNVNVQTLEKESLLKVFIEGEIDTFTAQILREQLDVIKINEAITIEIDLSKVNYMDSTGLGVFVAFYKKVIKENAHLKLVHLSSRLTRLFEITGLSELMNIDTGQKVES